MRRLAVAAAFFVLAACTSKGIGTLPPPPTTQPRPPTTPVVDLSGAQLGTVPGRTTTTVAMRPGRAVLQGVVVGPEGPVPGATVHVERLVGDGVAAEQVFTGPDGAFQMGGVLGGRFRVRAWRPLDLALTKPEVFFLNDGDTKQLQLPLTRYTGLAVSLAIAPNPPVVGEPANLVVQVVQQSVDQQGVVRGAPVPSTRVDLGGSGSWTVASPNPGFTDGQGRVTWQVRCRSAGSQPLAVQVGGSQNFPLDLPACVEPPPEEETTTTSSPSSSTSSSTTSTTRSTTSTTRSTTTTR